MANDFPGFERAQYVEPRTIEGNPIEPAGGGAFVRSLLFGAAAAVVGSAGYALVGLSGWMISIVAIAVGWLVGRAMMTGSGGIGGRSYQVSAAVLTYLAVTSADLLDEVHRAGIPFSQILRLPPVLLLKQVIAGPFLDLSSPLNGILGLIILAIGVRTAWRIAAGSPGFGQPNGARMGPFGIR